MSSCIDPATYKSVFAEEIRGLLAWREANGYNNINDSHLFRYFDQFCIENNIEENELTSNVIYGWLESEVKNGRTISKHKISAIRSLANYYSSLGKEAHLIDGYIVRKRQRPQPFLPDNDQIARLFLAIDNFPSMTRRDRFMAKEAFPVAARLAYSSGLRPKEVLDLHLRNINFQTGEILIEDTKGCVDRVIVAHPDALELLVEYTDKLRQTVPNADYLFAGKHGQRLSRSLATAWLQKCWQEANPTVPPENLQSITFYTFRHLYATTFIYNAIRQFGGDTAKWTSALSYLRRYMGHKSIDSTLYYVHLIPGGLDGGNTKTWEESMGNINTRKTI